ncbi:MAG: hypothetical protein H0S85_07535 [Desulfovibrionaceae bacterium]|jgi:hypothetical protein|nr:hypothetical protein [Desulfovibrionaceae bacterium]
MAGRVTFTPASRKRFLAALRGSGNVSEAARHAGVSRSRVYDLRAEDAAFAAAWDEALEAAVDALEEEVRRRALEGYEEPVFYGGEQVGVKRRYSDSLLRFLLARHRPEIYGPAGMRDREPADEPPPRVVIEMHFGPAPAQNADRRAKRGAEPDTARRPVPQDAPKADSEAAPRTAPEASKTG